MKSIFLVLSIILIANVSSAKNDIEEKVPQKGAGIDFPTKEDPALQHFTATNWSRGIHLFAGIGLNNSIYRREEKDRSYGIGLGITSAAGFVLNPDWMIEITSQLGFHHVDHFFLWDTIFAPGVRFRIPAIQKSTESSMYGRAFAGWGMAVILPHGTQERTHLSGPVVGLGVGFLHGKAKKVVWFIEGVTYLHVFRDQNIIRDVNTVPTVLAHSRVTNRSALLEFSLAIGLLAF